MIAKWKLKAIVQKGISFFPQKERINYWFQKNVTKGVELNDLYFEYKITHASDHLRFFEQFADRHLSECKILELGTGWYPIVPVALFLNDIKEVTSLDLSDWMSSANLRTTCRKFIEWRKQEKLSEFLPTINEDRWQMIRDLANSEGEELDYMCSKISLKRWIGDARNTEFDNRSFNLICSNNTFEHIPEDILYGILAEFARVIKPDGVMSHFIDMSDHFAHMDSSINIYNFLRYSDQVWNRIDNSIQPQNRMRFRDYKQMYKNLELPVSHEEVRRGDLEALKQVPLDQKYRAYEPAELAISHGYIVSKMNDLKV